MFSLSLATGAEPSHVHMIIGSNKNKLEYIVQDMKSYNSTTLRNRIKNNKQESRKEWMIWIACPDNSSGCERAEKKNGNNNGWQFWQHELVHLQY